MSLFRRRRSGRTAEPEDLDEPTGDETLDEVEDETGDDLDEDAGAADTDEDAEDAEAADGPYDVSDAPDDAVERLDLGALRVPAVPGVEVQVQANPQGEVTALVLIAGGNAVQLGAFAAPRTEGIWDEMRAELLATMRADGAKVTERDGEYGPEVAGRVSTPNGPRDIRFVGIDGPRWFVQAIFQGPVAADPDVAPELSRTLRGTVVDRGQEAMPVRAPLPLRLPPEMVEQQQDAAEGQANGRKAPGR